MRPPPEPICIDTLLAHRLWVRALARSLVFDAALADDLEQQTWVAALLRPPRADAPVRHWLGSVLRRQLARSYRGEARRTARQRAAARPESTSDSSTVVDHAEQHRRLVNAVMALAEPYRTTLLHRYYDDLPPREIARRMAVSAETVRSRVRRGVEQLRASLDARSGGDRRAWIAALLPQCGEEAATGSSARAPQSALFAAGVALVSTKSKIVAAVLVVCLVAVFVTLQSRSSADDVAPSGPSAAAPRDPRDAARSPRSLHRAAGADTRGDDDVATSGPESADTPQPHGAGVLVFAQLEHGRRPLAGARVWGVLPNGHEFRGRTNERGLWPAPARAAGSGTVWAAAEGLAATRLDEAVFGDRPIEIVLAPGRTVHVEFVDPAGARLARHEVERLYAAAGFVPSAEVTWSGVTDVRRQGALSPRERSAALRAQFDPRAAWALQVPLRWEEDAALLAKPLGPGGWRVLVWTPSRTPVVSAILDGGAAADAVVTVALPNDAETARVRIVDERTAEPLADARVVPCVDYGYSDAAPCTVGPALRTNHDGEVLLRLPGSFPRRANVGHPFWRVDNGTHALVIPGRPTPNLAQYAPEENRWTFRARPVVTVTGRAYADDGSPAAGGVVFTGTLGAHQSARVGADGRFRLEGVHGFAGNAVVLLESPDSPRSRMRLLPDLVGGTHEMVLGSPRAGAQGTRANAALEIRLTAGGTALPGRSVIVATLPASGASGDGDGPTVVHGLTDGTGRFELEELAPGPYGLVVRLGAPGVGGFTGIKSTSPLDLEAGTPRVVTFDLPAGGMRVDVVAADTAQPLAGAHVVARPVDPKARTRHGVGAGFLLDAGGDAVTDERGSCLVLGLPADASHSVDVRLAGYHRSTTDGHVPGTADEPSRVTIRLRRRRP